MKYKITNILPYSIRVEYGDGSWANVTITPDYTLEQIDHAVYRFDPDFLKNPNFLLVNAINKNITVGEERVSKRLENSQHSQYVDREQITNYLNHLPDNNISMVNDNNIEIIDNFLEEIIFINVLHQVLGLTWKYFPGKSSTITSIPNELNNYQFNRVLKKEDSEDYDNLDIISPILEKLNVNRLIRAKLNLSPYMGEKIIEYDMHVDTDLNCKTAVYYLNSNNGYTLFENGTIINSIRNRIVIFDSNLRHCGTTCTDQKNRIVLNLNFI